LVAAILGVAAAVCLWWLYFDMVSLAAEQRLLEARGQARVDLAVEAYTYGHFPIVAGIVLAALGIEGVLAHAGDSQPLGAFYALPGTGVSRSCRSPATCWSWLAAPATGLACWPPAPAR
jgi:low temperature requirement protein LtrA